MSLNSNELFTFLNKRYSYLDVISQAIKDLYNNFKDELVNQPIKYITSPLEQLYVLKNESVKRLDNDYYKGVINDLIMIFETEQLAPEHEAMATDYKESLLPLINEIRTNLQTMNIVDLDNTDLLDSQSDIGDVLSYEIGKFYSWIYGDRCDPLLSYYLERFNEVTNSKFNFSVNDSSNSLFVKLKLMIRYSNNRS